MKPKIAGKKPIAIELTEGEEKYFCACGESKDQPFCDGSHRTTSFKPLPFTPEKTETAYLCMCKQSKNLPYCDGTHTTLKDEASKTEKTALSLESTYEEPTLAYIKSLAKNGLTKTGHHGEMGAMGVPIPELPQWKDIQILAAQMANKPLMDDVQVGTELIIGPNAKKPLKHNSNFR